MTDPTPAEALKNLRHALIHVRDQLVALDGRTKGDCARLGDIRWHINQALAATPPDAGEVRTYREGVEDAAKLCDARRAEERSKGNLTSGHVAEDLAAAIRTLP